MIDEREEMLKALRAGPLVLDRLVRGLRGDAVRVRPEPGEWAHDPAALAEERGYLGMEIGEQVARFGAIRAEQVSLLATLDDAGWRRTGLHGEHGRISVQALAAHTAGEDADHLAQIARLIPGP